MRNIICYIHNIYTQLPFIHISEPVSLTCSNTNCIVSLTMQFVLEQGWEALQQRPVPVGTGQDPELDPTSFQNGW